jgi:hypothetical protein
VRSSRVRAPVALLVVVLLSATSCGLGDKQHRADAIIDAVDAAIAAGAAHGRLTVAASILETPDVGRAAEAADAVGGPPPPGTLLSPPIAYEAALDFSKRRAALSRDGKPAEVFDDLDFYGWRLAATDREARPWLRLRLADLEEGSGELRVPDDAPTAVLNAINPILLVDLAAGALAGSIRRGITETTNGVRLTRYDANFDVEKTLEKTRRKAYPEDERKTIETAFGLLTLKGAVNKGTVWLDEDGRLRGFSLELKVSRQRDFVFGVNVGLVITDFGAPIDVRVPADAEVLEAASMVAFLRAVVPEMKAR